MLMLSIGKIGSFAPYMIADNGQIAEDSARLHGCRISSAENADTCQLSMGEEMSDSALKRLREALEVQRQYLAFYEQPAEPLAYETVRALDDLFCRDMMEPSRPLSDTEQKFRSLSTWGVNHALRRIIPRSLKTRPFREFPSHAKIQRQADDFIFNCATLELAERFDGWLRDGILSGELRRYPGSGLADLKAILVLRSATPSFLDEEISMTGLRWASDQRVAKDSPLEHALEGKHRQIEPDLHRRVDLIDGWRVVYTSNAEIDEYFMEWARLYLRRIFSQDMIGPEEKIGGRPFSRYLEVLSVLSGRSQMQIAFAAIVKARWPDAHIRNLLTTYCARERLIENIARYLDGERREIDIILKSLTLGGDNLEVHTGNNSPAWAPLVQASTEALILPIYGIDINPFLFLLTDLRHRYQADWFRVANDRERRWIEEISRLFGEPRWKIHGNLRLREAGKDITDIDFAVFEREANQLALFQLKWQYPVGLNNRGRRSAGKNLISESNRWIESVTGWLERHGIDDLLLRFGFKASRTPAVFLFVLGRYHVHLSGFENHDPRAVWSDWAHFQQALAEGSETTTVSQIASMLQMKMDESRATKRGESIMFPVGDVAIVLNPTSVPSESSDLADGSTA